MYVQYLFLERTCVRGGGSAIIARGSILPIYVLFILLATLVGREGCWYGFMRITSL
jgi:hypothetical protein